jgi:branched-chain amino acid transport system ATP-binding protein
VTDVDEPSGNVLAVKGLSAGYNGVEAIRNISLSVDQGQIVTLIGPNGAGKSTLLKAIIGTASSTGTVSFGGQDISKWPTPRRVRGGIALVPEGRGVLPEMSVAENLMMGGFCRRDRRSSSEQVQRMFDLFPELATRHSQLAGTLSGGEQQMLAVGRALVGEPRLLMLDEPSLGLAPKVVTRIFEVIADLATADRSVLLVEQNASVALEAAQYGYVLETGDLALKGSSAELQSSSLVKRVYLGGG